MPFVACGGAGAKRNHYLDNRQGEQ